MLQNYNAELLQEGIIFLLHLFAKTILVMKKLKIKGIKANFLISLFFIKKIALAKIWMSFS
jgi:hypothetical protein